MNINDFQTFVEQGVSQIVTNDLKNNGVNEHIGKYVFAGGNLNGIYGHIVGAKSEYDDVFDMETTWYYVKNEENGVITKWDISELKHVTIGVIYNELEREE